MNKVEAEIVRLHDFFVEWFTGALPQDAASFSQAEDVLSETFVIVSPDGSATERAELLAQLHGAHGRRPDIRIWIKDVKLRQQYGPISIATYEEWQEMGGETTVRLSTVVFCEKESAPNGLEWLHVHETWRT